MGDLLFLVNEAGILTCLNAESGAVVWRTRLGGNFSASPTYANGKIYLCSEEGKTFVIAVDRTYRELAVNTLPGRFIASPAVLDRALYCAPTLICIASKPASRLRERLQLAASAGLIRQLIRGQVFQ